MSTKPGRSDIIRIYYLAETAVIGFIADCRPTATTPRDKARTTEGNIVIGFDVSGTDEYFFELNETNRFGKMPQCTDNYLTETISEKTMSISSSYAVEKK